MPYLSPLFMYMLLRTLFYTSLIVHTVSTSYSTEYLINKRVFISDPLTKCIFHKQLYTKMILNPVQLTSSLDNKSRSHSLSKSFRASYNTLKCTGFFPSLTCWAKALQRSATIWSSVKSPKNNIRFRKLFFQKKNGRFANALFWKKIIVKSVFTDFLLGVLLWMWKCVFFLRLLLYILA